MKKTIVNASQPSDLHTTSVGRTGWLFSWKNILKKTRARSSFLLLVNLTRLAPNLSEVRCPAFCVLRSSMVGLN